MQDAVGDTLGQVFITAAMKRSQILSGQRVPNDLELLYNEKTGLLNIPDRHVPIVSKGMNPTMPVRLTPNIWAFQSLLRCFAGCVADMPLPPGAFFSGSSVLAALTIPCDLATPDLVAALTTRGRQHARLRQIRHMAVARCLEGAKTALSSKIMEFVGGYTMEEIQHLREDIAELMPRRDGHSTSPDDVLYWDWNGFGFWSRSDIDIFLAVKEQEEGNQIAKEIYKRLTHLEGNDVCCVKTPNTVTFARSYPERHCQCVLLTMQHVHHHLLFADLCCTATAVVQGIPFTTERSRAALSAKVNVVPTSMLAIRRDSPKRVARYIQRGFVPMFLEDKRAGDVSIQMQTIREEMEFKGKGLLDLFLYAELEGNPKHVVDIEPAVKYLVSTNTSYSAFALPRMINLSALGIESFFQKLAEKAFERDANNHLITALISSAAGIPPCSSKLEKSRRETWASYGMIRR